MDPSAASTLRALRKRGVAAENRLYCPQPRPFAADPAPQGSDAPRGIRRESPIDHTSRWRAAQSANHRRKPALRWQRAMFPSEITDRMESRPHCRQSHSHCEFFLNEPCARDAPAPSRMSRGARLRNRHSGREEGSEAAGQARRRAGSRVSYEIGAPGETRTPNPQIRSRLHDIFHGPRIRTIDGLNDDLY